MMFFWVVILIVLVYFLLRGDLDIKLRRDDPHQALDERLARGDISIAEYQRIKQVLEEKNK